ncbi:hypothetical protein ACLK1S_14095 [Escherichia coli]
MGQTGPKVGSFDGGWGTSCMARIRRAEKSARNLVPVPSVTQNRRWIWALSTGDRWQIWKRKIHRWSRNAAKQPDGAALPKAALNADCDGQAGLQSWRATPPCCLYITSGRRSEGRNAFNQKRSLSFSKFERNA